MLLIAIFALCWGGGYCTMAPAASRPSRNGDYPTSESADLTAVRVSQRQVPTLPYSAAVDSVPDRKYRKRSVSGGDLGLGSGYADNAPRPSSRLVGHPQSFLRYFDVQLNTIIRTHDSRMRGAEYLNETEKRSNEECLTWCWETPKCNVAVFAEKNGGSCYLFDCGPLSAFKCQFTSHGNYKSSILKVPTNSPANGEGLDSGVYDFDQWKSQVKHENELASLRGNLQKQMSVFSSTVRPPLRDKPQPTRNEEEVTLLPPQPSVAASENPPTSNNACKHYQFQCRQNKECIAIYNVCDGIPQCNDASDEAEDLHCPKSNGNPMETKPEATLPPPPAPVGTLVPFTRVGPPPIQNNTPLRPSTHRLPDSTGQLDNRPSKPDESLEDGPRTRLDTDRLSMSATYQKELLNTRLGGTAMNRGPSREKLDRPMEEPKNEGSNWNAGSYPLGRDPDDYAPNRETDANRFAAAQGSRPFSNKHSNFMPASSNYRPQSPSGGNSRPNYPNPPQWSVYNENAEAGSRASSLDNTRNPGLSASDLDYSGRYEPSAYRDGVMNGANAESVYRHQMETPDGPGGLSSYGGRYRNDERYWSANSEPQMAKLPYAEKSEESQMLPTDLDPHLKPSSFLTGYGDSMNPAGPIYKGQHEEGGYGGLTSSKSMAPSSRLPQHPVYQDGGVRIAHNHGAVVQPQVQNDESPEDAIYEPQAELPAMRNTLPPTTSHEKVPIRKKENNKGHHHPTTVTSSPSTMMPAPVTTAAKATGKLKAIHPSVRVNPVPGARSVSQITAESGMTVAELQQASRVHARESNSAVLALSLGLCVTAVLLVLVGCRMKNIKRRLARRGGRSSLTHDADYLVNGMYL